MDPVNNLTGMANVINTVQSTITADALWGVIGDIFPIVGVVLLFSLGLYFLRKAVKGAAKGKVRM